MLQVRKKGTKFQIRPLIRTNGGKMRKTKWTFLPKKVTLVEIDWKAAQNAAIVDGYIKLYINGTLKRSKTNVPNDKMTIDLVRLGITKKLGASVSASGAIFLDAFISNDSYYIGP